MKKTTYLMLMLSVVLYSCSLNQGKQDSNEKKIDFPKSFYKKLKGTIGDNIPITMDLTKSDSVLTGTYFYNRVRIPLSIKGQINATLDVQLIETNDKNKVTGTFSGKFTTANSIDGTWTNPTNGKSLPFKLTETTDSVASISIESYHKVNCLKAEKFKRNPSEITGAWDTVCSTLDLTFLKITASSQTVSDLINLSLLKTLCGQCKSVADYLNSFANQKPEFYSKAEISFYMSLNENNVLSIGSLELREDEGAAHPTHYTTFYNYDLLSGNQINLNDILTPNFASTLIPVAERNFIKQWGTDEKFDPINVKFDNDFEICTTGLGFHYIGTYIGADMVYIPYNDINELIQPNGLISRFWHKKNRR